MVSTRTVRASELDPDDLRAQRYMLRTEIYYPDGRVLVKAWKKGTRPAYEWTRRAVEGYIEAVDRFLPDGGPDGCVQAYANEEGRLNNLDVNIPGMKALDWPEPTMGWDAYDRHLDTTERKAPPPDGPIFMHGGMSAEELADAHQQILNRWDPVVGPVVILRGWREENYESDKGSNPDDLGEEFRIGKDGALVPTS